MTSWNGLALALWILLSTDATLTLAQYVMTVTISINDNPLCTPVSGIKGSGGSAGNASGSGASGTNGAGVGGPAPALGYAGSHASGSGNASATNSSIPVLPIDTGSGRWIALGYYAVPKDGYLLNGPASTSPEMTVELCGTDCHGYTFLALANGNECNCGSSAPSSSSSSSLQSKNKRQTTGNDCTGCAGDTAECCGAPGGYALLYQFTPYAESSSVVAYSWTDSAGSVIEASSTAFSGMSLASIIAYTSTGSNGYIAVGSTTSYGALALASTCVYNSTTSAGSIMSATSTSLSPLAAASIGPGPAVGIGGGPNSGTGFSGLHTGFGSGFSSTAFIPSGPGPSSVSYSIDNMLSTVAAPTTRVLGSSVATSSIATATTAGIAPAALGVNGSIVGVGGGNATTSNGAMTTNDGGGGAEPTVASPTPSCVNAANYAGNNTKYIDYFGYTYDIRCNLDLQSTPSDYDAYAENFEDCLEYCSLLKDCIAVTYQDPPSSATELRNCHPKWTFGGYKTSTVDGFYSGVNVDSASSGTLESQDLCTMNNIQGASYDGTTYYDDFGTAWIIGCDVQLAISSTGAALSSTVADTLASCIDYCSRYDSCTMVNWTGSHANGTLNDPNCFPASLAEAAGAAGSAPGSAYATLDSQ